MVRLFLLLVLATVTAGPATRAEEPPAEGYAEKRLDDDAPRREGAAPVAGVTGRVRPTEQDLGLSAPPWAINLPPRLLDLPTLDLGGDERRAAEQSRRAGATYSFGDSWSANVSYRHAFLFGEAPERELREASAGAFSTDRERDVFNLKMSWGLKWSSVDLGYRFESTRADPGGVDSEEAGRSGWFPGSADSRHGLMLGVTTQWGGTR